MTWWTSQLENDLVRTLSSLDWVQFAYLFGSTAQARARDDSDLDLAVKVDGDPTTRLWELLGDLGTVVPAPRLHLVLFEQASSLLQQRIFRDGRLLYEADPRQRKAYQVRVLREFCDFQPRREFFLSALKRRLASHG